MNKSVNDYLYSLDTVSLEEIANELSNTKIKEQESIDIQDLHKRIDVMHKKLLNIQQCDDCLIQ